MASSLLMLEEPVLFKSRAAATAAKEQLLQPGRAGGKSKASATSAGGTAATADSEDVIDLLLPPRVVSFEDGTAGLQHVSKEPPTRAHAVELKGQLNSALAVRHARDGGLCPIRQELHWQAFDEVIRQVTLGCPERGLLLLRARDQLVMTMESYRMLHDASVAFGVRKQVQSEEGMQELEQAVSAAVEKKRALEAKAVALRARIDAAEKRQAERKASEERRRNEELAFLRQQAKHLDGFLKALPRQ